MAKITAEEAKTLFDAFCDTTNGQTLFKRLVAQNIYTERGSDVFDSTYVKFEDAFHSFVSRTLVEEGTARDRDAADVMVGKSHFELDSALMDAILDAKGKAEGEYIASSSKKVKAAFGETTVAALIDMLQDEDPLANVYAVVQPNYPMVASIDRVEGDRHTDGEARVYIHMSDNEEYYSSEDEVEDEDDDDY